MKDIDLHVGYDPTASKARVLDAIRRAEADATTAGLLDRTQGGGVCAAYDEIRTLISLVPAA